MPPAAGTAGPATAGGVAAGDRYVAAAGCGLGTAAAGCTAGTTASTVSLRSGGTYVVLSSYRVLSANGLSCTCRQATSEFDGAQQMISGGKLQHLPAVDKDLPCEEWLRLFNSLYETARPLLVASLAGLHTVSNRQASPLTSRKDAGCQGKQRCVRSHQSGWRGSHQTAGGFEGEPWQRLSSASVVKHVYLCLLMNVIMSVACINHVDRMEHV